MGGVSGPEVAEHSEMPTEGAAAEETHTERRASEHEPA